MIKKKISDIFFQFSLSKWRIKVALIFFGLFFLIAAFIFSRGLLDELIAREKKTIELYADIYRRSLDPDADLEELAFLFDKISPTISFPIIIADKNDEPNKPFNVNTKNVELDSNLTEEEQEKILSQKIKEMAKNYPPIVVRDKNGKILQKFYYSNSKLIDELRYFWMIELGIVAVFVLIGYAAFSNIKRAEESKVWVGMSKEAAHQLGTPLSSMLAWLEIVKLNADNPETIKEAAAEMEKDVERLNTIAVRFSKIGSQPEKKVENLYVIIETVCSYFEKRLPRLGRKISISRSLDRELYAEINLDLFQWVMENLLKNAAEAIETKSGKIEIIARKTPNKNSVEILIKDNGKGMTKKQRRQIFYPGYTTKKRGWGLGLSLCKRIVEEYHDGKIYVKDSQPGKGTVFAIEVPLTRPS